MNTDDPPKIRPRLRKLLATFGPTTEIDKALLLLSIRQTVLLDEIAQLLIKQNRRKPRRDRS